jgi:2-polyprenyl-6-methoxyphenol hydroxylase-like FAD-dependent oxidoreductase
MTLRCDVLIVGARAAGAATALLLARAGLGVVVIDRGQRGTDTLSTHSLMRPAVLQLLRWGALPRLIAAGTPPIRGSRFYYGDVATTVGVKNRDGVDALFAPRRTVLDRVLVDMAAEAGARVQFGASLGDYRRRPGGVVATVTGASATSTINASLIVGADGRHSKVAELSNAPIVRRGRHASAVVYGYWQGLDIREYWWSYGNQISAGAIPTNDGETCVFASIPSERFQARFGADLAAGYHEVIAASDAELDSRLRSARRSSALRGFPGMPGYVRQSSGPGWALVGDAAHFKDPITAHGITDALRDAELLAGAIGSGTPVAFAAYERERDRLSQPIFDVSDRMAAYDWDARTVERHLRDLSEAMAEEARTILGWAPPPGAVMTPASSAEPARTTPAPWPDRTPAG